MQDIEKLIKHHDFSRRGNIESHKTESGFNNQVVVANVLNMYVKKCEQTVDCWLKEVDGWLKEVDRKEKKESAESLQKGKKQVQKESRKEKWKVWKSICMCLHHQNRLNHSMFVFPHMKIRWGRHRQNTHLPNGSAGCIEIRPDLDCFSVQDNRSARRWMNKHEQREWQRGRQMQLAVVQIKAARAAHKCGLCARGEHDFSGCTECRLSKNHGHWAQDCPEARKADWNERNGEQERRGRVTGIQQATKKGSKNLLTHTHNTLTYTDSNTALCNEDMLANLLCVSVCKFWIRLSAMKKSLQTLLCVEVLSKTMWLMNVWECTKV